MSENNTDDIWLSTACPPKLLQKPSAASKKRCLTKKVLPRKMLIGRSRMNFSFGSTPDTCEMKKKQSTLNDFFKTRNTREDAEIKTRKMHSLSTYLSNDDPVKLFQYQAVENINCDTEQDKQDGRCDLLPVQISSSQVESLKDKILVPTVNKFKEEVCLCENLPPSEPHYYKNHDADSVFVDENKLHFDLNELWRSKGDTYSEATSCLLYQHHMVMHAWHCHLICALQIHGRVSKCVKFGTSQETYDAEKLNTTVGCRNFSRCSGLFLDVCFETTGNTLIKDESLDLHDLFKNKSNADFIAEYMCQLKTKLEGLHEQDLLSLTFTEEFLTPSFIQGDTHKVSVFSQLSLEKSDEFKQQREKHMSDLGMFTLDDSEYD